jgi:hypothetical protein
MVNRIIIDANGIKVSPPGVEVTTAASGQLVLDMTANRPQMVSQGVTGGGDVPLVGFSVPPLVFFYRFQPSGAWNIDLGVVDIFMRPWPYWNGVANNGQASVVAGNISFAGLGGNWGHYFVFREALP